MNINLKRHELLKLLSPSFIKFNSNNTDSEFKLGVSFNDLQKELNVSRDDIELIYSKLEQDSEVCYTNTAVVGLILTQKGLTSFSDEKYIKIDNEIILKNLQKDLIKSNIDTNSENLAINKTIKTNSNISIGVAVLTFAVLFFQVIYTLSNQKYQQKLEIKSIETEEELKTKNEQLIDYHNQVDSLTLLLSNQTNSKIKSKE